MELNDKQLKWKVICSIHFEHTAYVNLGKFLLKKKAVPICFKKIDCNPRESQNACTIDLSRDTHREIHSIADINLHNIPESTCNVDQFYKERERKYLEEIKNLKYEIKKKK